MIGHKSPSIVMDCFLPKKFSSSTEEARMTKITFIEHNGTEHPVDAENGAILMRVGQANQIPTIIGECGGTCSCGSCQVYVDEEWFPKLKPPHELEQMMIDSLELTKQPTSRLTCMILVTPELEGLKLRLMKPDF
jgi:2Fe-2S ferredoxin